jgi:signal transduction histidine kinase
MTRRASGRPIEAFISWWERRDRQYSAHLDRNWERLGERYWWLQYVFVLGISVALWLVALTVATLYVRISSGQYWSLAGFESACLLLAGAWTIDGVRRGPARPIVEWVHAGKPVAGALRAWRAAVELPWRSVVQVALWRYLVAGVLPLGVFVGVVLGRPWLVAFTAAFSLAGALFTPMALNYLVCDWYVGPVKREASRLASPNVETRRPTSSLRLEVLVALTVINDGTAVFSGMLSSTGHVSLSTILVGQSIGFCVASLIAFGLSMLATESIVCPIDDLVTAAEAIRAGDLSARVTVVSADEIGILASRFNSMAAELQGARERLVSAREEERRRVRRDLHDGLGPSLAALVMQLDLVGDLVDDDPGAAREAIAGLKAQTREAIADIRRLVYELRPPSLDQLGLVGALRDHASRLTGGGTAGPGVAVELRVPGELPPLPAAVEVAAYRIAQEAMTNVVRHAAARACTVELSLNGGLELVVRDDGCGIAAAPGAGVGLASMRERAAELGGSCSIGPADGGGTCVRACLPLPR